MMSIESVEKNTKRILEKISQWNGRKLALATKTHFSLPLLQSALSQSENIIIAENRIQEAEKKWDILQKFPHKKHFIGKLQSNKVKKAVKMFDCIETVDSLKLLARINRIAGELYVHNGKKLKREVFLNINISHDENKSGIEPEYLKAFVSEVVNTPEITQHITVSGIFTILKKDITNDQKRKYYKEMKQIQDEIQQLIPSVTEISMGMSADYEIALEEGATIVRIGRGIFGERKKDTKDTVDEDRKK